MIEILKVDFLNQWSIQSHWIFVLEVLWVKFDLSFSVVKLLTLWFSIHLKIIVLVGFTAKLRRAYFHPVHFLISQFHKLAVTLTFQFLVSDLISTFQFHFSILGLRIKFYFISIEANVLKNKSNFMILIIFTLMFHCAALVYLGLVSYFHSLSQPSLFCASIPLMLGWLRLRDSTCGACVWSQYSGRGSNSIGCAISATCLSRLNSHILNQRTH